MAFQITNDLGFGTQLSPESKRDLYDAAVLFYSGQWSKADEAFVALQENSQLAPRIIFFSGHKTVLELLLCG